MNILIHRLHMNTVCGHTVNRLGGKPHNAIKLLRSRRHQVDIIFIYHTDLPEILVFYNNKHTLIRIFCLEFTGVLLVLLSEVM